MKNGDADRKTRIADAAIDVLGRDGLRALTHRAVDARAGLPQGTSSYHHRTRRSLLAAVLHRIADLDRADMAAAAPSGSSMVEPGPVTSALRPIRILPSRAPAGRSGSSISRTNRISAHVGLPRRARGQAVAAARRPPRKQTLSGMWRMPI